MTVLGYHCYLGFCYNDFVRKRSRRILSKNCRVCKKSFSKPVICSVKDWKGRRFCSQKCKATSQIGAPSPKRGKIYLHLRWSKGVPCRICGGPSGRYDRDRVGIICCQKETCREASRKLKNANIGAALKKLYETGVLDGQRNKGNWKHVRRVSVEEDLLWTKVQKLGFQRQVKVLTGVHTFHLPRCFWLDFGIPEYKFYVEVDGKIHQDKDRQERDSRRKTMLEAVGWQGIRVDNEEVRLNCNRVVRGIKKRLQEIKTDLKEGDSKCMDLRT